MTTRNDGPFETLADATTSARRSPVGRAHALQLACAEAGVSLGRFDRRVLDEVSAFDTEVVWVLAAIIRRAGGSNS
ncbi:hypothetical protein KPL76_10355 [Subtercola sp. PAMC28395]|uniref:hypothetical protein n=1 Tax=Subtercola sp. PAMC28395 TaxID=2846775 RepID=UPI001C0BA43B|nr:hypothetical protein [Subtercola sp. PAMC28395]QWT23146.1 hypothetical protein KPL76_10355 [Subtercola sp. PAMC28395]